MFRGIKRSLWLGSCGTKLAWSFDGGYKMEQRNLSILLICMYFVSQRLLRYKLSH